MAGDNKATKPLAAAVSYTVPPTEQLKEVSTLVTSPSCTILQPAHLSKAAVTLLQHSLVQIQILKYVKHDIIYLGHTKAIDAIALNMASYS